MKVKWHQVQSGFTLLETVIVLAIVGLLTLFVLGNSNGTTANERFSGSVHNFAATITDAQTKSYSVQTGTSGCGSTEGAPGGTGGTACFWRGNVMTFTTGQLTYSMSLIYGTDLSLASVGTNPRQGLDGLQAFKTYPLSGLQLTGIALLDSTGHVFATPGTVSLAFLAPDGKAYSCYTGSCLPSVLNPAPYQDGSSAVRLSFSQPGSTRLTAQVTFDPVSGTISTIVQ